MKNEYFIQHNFLGLPPELSDEENSKIYIVPVPFDGTVTHRAGARNGPAAIVEASISIEWYDALLKKEPCRAGIHTLPLLEPCTNVEHMLDRVTAVTHDILAKDKFPVVLGGEHSITYGVFRALKQKYGNVTVMQLDAHADLRDSYLGDKYNHACVMRRIAGETSYAGAGIRSIAAEEAEWIDQNGICCLPPSMFNNRQYIAERLDSVLRDPVYITIDLDVFDHSIMPAVGTPEPGGILWDDALWILQHVCTRYRVIGFDVVELCPIPGYIAPDVLAAKLVNHTIGLIF